MIKKYNRGFTLIELLVVIAIIGILASVVLISLQSARKKGNDSRVISDVQQLRTQAEAVYNGSNYNAALVAGNNGIAAGNGIITTAGSAPKQLSDDAVANGGVLFAKTTSGNVTAYAIYGSLPSTNNASYFCIGSDGSTKQSTATVISNANLLTTSPICS
jgi:prepilin-type N-terminal cleavage/methylation domain-containing protein